MYSVRQSVRWCSDNRLRFSAQTMSLDTASPRGQALGRICAEQARILQEIQQQAQSAQYKRSQSGIGVGPSCRTDQGPSTADGGAPRGAGKGEGEPVWSVVWSDGAHVSRTKATNA